MYFQRKLQVLVGSSCYSVQSDNTETQRILVGIMGKMSNPNVTHDNKGNLAPSGFERYSVFQHTLRPQTP